MDQIKFPITVKMIRFRDSDCPVNPGAYPAMVGKFVSVRPVVSIDAEEKTYLGIYLGEIDVMPYAGWDEESGDLFFYSGHGNPAIFVFDLNQVVMGYESWWGPIESESDLKQITDADIQDIWYVKAMRELCESEKEASVGN